VQDRSLYIDFSPELTLVILVTITAVDDTKSILGIVRQELSRTLACCSKNIHQQTYVFSWRTNNCACDRMHEKHTIGHLRSISDATPY
jgi:hypothetical protein